MGYSMHKDEPKGNWKKSDYSKPSRDWKKNDGKYGSKYSSKDEPKGYKGYSSKDEPKDYKDDMKPNDYDNDKDDGNYGVAYANVGGAGASCTQRSQCSTGCCEGPFGQGRCVEKKIDWTNLFAYCPAECVGCFGCRAGTC